MTTEGATLGRRGTLVRWLLLLCATTALAVVLVMAEVIFANALSHWTAWKPFQTVPSMLLYLSVVHALIAHVVVRVGALIGRDAPQRTAWATFVWGAMLAGLLASRFAPDPGFDAMAAVIGAERAMNYALAEYATGWVPFLAALGAGALTARRIAARDRALNHVPF